MIQLRFRVINKAIIPPHQHDIHYRIIAKDGKEKKQLHVQGKVVTDRKWPARKNDGYGWDVTERLKQNNN